MRREAAEYINGILDQDDPDISGSEGSSRISQIILTGGKAPEVKADKAAVVDDSRGRLTDVVGFKK